MSAGVTGITVASNVTQVDCATASRWDLFGIISPDLPDTPLPTTTTSTMVTSTSGNSTVEASTSGISTVGASTGGISTVGVSTGELVAVSAASIIGTALIALVIGYLFIKHYKQQKLIENDPVNVQIIDN